MTAIQSRNLGKQFRRTPALVSVDLDIAQGSIHAILGPNGVG